MASLVTLKVSLASASTPGVPDFTTLKTLVTLSVFHTLRVFLSTNKSNSNAA